MYNNYYHYDVDIYQVSTIAAVTVGCVSYSTEVSCNFPKHLCVLTSGKNDRVEKRIWFPEPICMSERANNRTKMCFFPPSTSVRMKISNK